MKPTEPSIIQKIHDNVLESSILEPINFPQYPLHSQSVEHSVKLVTEAASQVVGAENRHKNILTKLKARASHKAFDTKKDLSYADL